MLREGIECQGDTSYRPWHWFGDPKLLTPLTSGHPLSGHNLQLGAESVSEIHFTHSLSSSFSL